MDNSPQLGPHEGKELALMLSGDKNVAYFSDADFLPVEFLPYIQQKIFLTLDVLDILDVEWARVPIKGIIVYKPEYQKQALRLSELVLSAFDPDTEREIGHILGYRDIDVEYFIAHFQANLARQSK